MISNRQFSFRVWGSLFSAPIQDLTAKAGGTTDEFPRLLTMHDPFDDGLKALNNLGVTEHLALETAATDGACTG